MSFRYLLVAVTFSLAAKKPVGLEWSENCCSYAAAVQVLYGFDEFRDFLIENKDLIRKKGPGTQSEALVGIFSRIKQAEDSGEEMVPYDDLKGFYKKLGLTGNFTDAFMNVFMPLLQKIDEEIHSYLQELWPQFKKLCIAEFKYRGAPSEYRPIVPVSRQEVGEEVADDNLQAIIFPRYQAVYGGLTLTREPLALSISRYEELGSILTVVPRGRYELVGAFRVTNGHVAAVRSDGLWYFCDGKSVREMTLDELCADYQTLTWRFYAHQPLIETIEEFGGALTQLLDFLP